MTKNSNSHSVTITSGEFRGQVLKTPKGATHPMGSREKLALFNLIGVANFFNATVLDAYAGSGALGFEALSHGAKMVFFVEKDREAVQTIKENARKLQVLDRARVVKAPVTIFAASYRPEHGLRNFADLRQMEKFDLILADPPYDHFVPEEIDDLSFLLRQGGILALSHPGDPPRFPWISLVKTRTYAGARISVYRKDTNYQPHM